MPDLRKQPFTTFLADLDAQLGDLSTVQRAEIERELLAHLADAAADEQAADDDPLFQRRVIARLGRSFDMAQAFKEAYGTRLRGLSYAGFLVLLLAAVGQLTISLAWLAYGYSGYRQSALSTERWVGQWDAAQQAMVWQLEVGPSGLPAPWLNLLSVGALTVLGLALLGGLLLYRRGVQRARRLVYMTALLTLLALVLYQGYDGVQFIYVLFTALPGLVGLLCLWLATRRQPQSQMS